MAVVTQALAEMLGFAVRFVLTGGTSTSEAAALLSSHDLIGRTSGPPERLVTPARPEEIQCST